MQIEIVDAAIEDCQKLTPIFFNEHVVKYTNFKLFDNQSALEIFFKKFLKIRKGEPLQYGPYIIQVDGNVAGMCGLQQMEISEGNSEVWYLLDEKYWGQGIAGNVLNQLIELATSNPLMNRIYAEAVSENPASWKLLEKTGFVLQEEKENGFVKGEIIASLRCYIMRL